MESQTSEIDIKPTVDLDKFIESFSIDENSGTPRNGFAVYLCNKYNIDNASSTLDSVFMQHISGYASNEWAVYVKLKYLISKVTKYRKDIENFLLEPLTVSMQKLNTRKVSTTYYTSEGATLEGGPRRAKKKMESQTSETDIKTSFDLDKFIESFSVDVHSGIPRNGFAVYLCNKYNIDDASSALDSIFMQHIRDYAYNERAVYEKLKYLISKVTKYRKDIENFLLEPITVPVQNRKTRTVRTTDVTDEATMDGGPPSAKKITATDVKTRADLDQLIESYSGDENTGILRKGFAVYLLCKKYMFNIRDATTALDNIFMKLDSSYSSYKMGAHGVLRGINIRFTSLSKSVNWYWPKIEKFLMEPIRAPRKRTKAQPSNSTAETAVDMSERAAQEVEPPPAKQLRRGCEQCLSVREECRAKCRALENTLKEKRRVIQTMRKLYNVKNVNQQHKRLHKRIAKLKSKLKDLKKIVANQEVAKTQKRKKVPTSSKPANETQTIQLFHLSGEVPTLQLSKPTFEVQTIQSSKPSDKAQAIKIKLSKPTGKVQTLKLCQPAGEMLTLPKPISQMQPITLSKATDEVQTIQLSQPTANVQIIKSYEPTDKVQTIQLPKPADKVQTIQLSQPTDNVQTIKSYKPTVELLTLPKPTSQ